MTVFSRPRPGGLLEGPGRLCDPSLLTSMSFSGAPGPFFSILALRNAATCCLSVGALGVGWPEDLGVDICCSSSSRCARSFSSSSSSLERIIAANFLFCFSACKAALRFGGIVASMQRANVGLLDEDVGSEH
jgi:hypothetical protein